MLTDITIEDDRWTVAGLGPLAEAAARATLAHLDLEPDLYEISLLGCDDARIAVLNADFRGKPAPTNVLSWPAQDLAAPEDGGTPDLPEDCPEDDPFGMEEGEAVFLGDIAIAYDTCAAEAAAGDKPLADHVTHLVIHATLHLLGHDHIRDKDATLMESIEVAILGKLGLPDPY